MAKTRKTFDVETLLTRVNHFLLHSEDDKKGEREGMLTLLEGVLMDTGNYHGFGYLDERDMELSENGVSVGVRRNESEEQKFWYTDHTRVVYYFRK